MIIDNKKESRKSAALFFCFTPELACLFPIFDALLGRVGLLGEGYFLLRYLWSALPDTASW